MDYIHVSLIHKITTETCCTHMTCKWSPKETEKHPEKFVQGCFIASKGLHKAIYKKTGEKRTSRYEVKSMYTESEAER